MNAPPLLAKSVRPGETPTRSHTLPGHLEDVVEAARQIIACTGRAQLQALKLAPEAFEERLGRLVTLSAALHDLGKANDHFQGMIYGIRQEPQGLRHEWVTWLILELPEVRAWLEPLFAREPEDRHVVLWSVVGHHPAYNHPSPPRLLVPGAGRKLTLLLEHADFGECLRMLGREFRLDAPPPLVNQTVPLTGPGNVFVRLAHWHQDAMRLWTDAETRLGPLVGAVKNSLIAADVAGSALPPEIPEPEYRATWIREAFANDPQPGVLNQIVTRKLNGDTLRSFQQHVGDSRASVTFVRAGCGSGKTLAGYFWAARQHPGRRLYFCYPTTGTATEGFRDYLYAPEGEAALLHSRAAVDLDVLGVTGDQDGSAQQEQAARIDALDTWSLPVVSCTVDTVLGIVQNNRRGLLAWPALTKAAFVFDEIHAYDDRLFGALLRFLQTFPGLPALLMTASLPNLRLRLLRQCVAQRRGEQLAEIAGPVDLEKRLRYHRQGAIGVEDPLSIVRETLKNNGKVLWVCNTVKRVLEAAERAKDLQPLVYHSRFRYEDRVRQHGEVIKKFNSSGPVLAISSQVCEMSLDLSASLLVTDLAPVPAVTQRLGRLNRRAQQGDSTYPFVVVLPSDDGKTLQALPYTPEELEAARRWLDRLGNDPLSQADLTQAWEQDEAGRRPDPVESAWLDGGPVTSVLELRETSPGVTVVLSQDLPALERYRKRLALERARARGRTLPAEVYRPLAGEKRPVEVALPMPSPPRGLAWRSGQEFHGLPVVDQTFIHYDPERGARWQNP